MPRRCRFDSFRNCCPGILPLADSCRRAASWSLAIDSESISQKARAAALPSDASGSSSANSPGHHPVQYMVAHDQRMKEHRAEMCNKSEEKQVCDDCVQLSQNNIECRAMRKDRGQMERAI